MDGPKRILQDSLLQMAFDRLHWTVADYYGYDELNSNGLAHFVRIVYTIIRFIAFIVWTIDGLDPRLVKT